MFFGKIKDSPRDFQWLKRELSQGKAPKEALEISDSLLSDSYQAAYSLLEEEEFLEAQAAFLFLVSLDPHCFEFWLGLGMAHQKCSDFESAIDAYEMAANQELENPISYFYLAKCFFAIHDHKNALKALDLAIEYSENIAEFATLNQEAELAKKLLIKDQE